MPCKVHVAIEVQSDILDCDATARQQIRDFLLELQEDPVPAKREPMGLQAFYQKLPCGYFVSWEIIGDMLKLVLTGSTKGITVRILGVALQQPRAYKSR